MPQPTLPPPPMADLTVPLAKGAAIIAAGQLDLFRALGQAPSAIPDLARRLEVDEVGLTRLVELLQCVGYLERVEGRYANGPVPRAWLTPASQVDFSSVLAWSAEVWRLLEDLAASIRRGGPTETMYQLMAARPDQGRDFALYMRASAQLSAAAIAQVVTLPPDARRLLDLGGSHGLHSIAFCRRYPELSATVFDLPVALMTAGETIAAEHPTVRVVTRAGDYLADDLGQGWDVVLCFNLLHNHHAEENRQLVAKVARALRPGGMIVVQDFLRPDPPDAFNAAFSLLMFNQNGTRTYQYEEIADWLRAARFDDIQRVDLPPAGQSSVVTAARGEP